MVFGCVIFLIFFILTHLNRQPRCQWSEEDFEWLKNLLNIFFQSIDYFFFYYSIWYFVGVTFFNHNNYNPLTGPLKWKAYTC